MASIFPFKALRVQPEFIEQFSATAADSDVRDDAEGEGKENPYSFLHILNPQLYSTDKLAPEEIFSRATSKLQELRQDCILNEDEKDAIYIYRQVKDNNVYTCIIALAAIDEYLGCNIKKHELTHTEKEGKITRYFQEVGINGNPVLLTYPDQPSLNILLQELVEAAPDYNFTGEEGIEHSLWVISDKDKIIAVEDAFKKIPDLYIADGHHRCAALSSMHPKVSRFMACLISSSQLNIHGFHRYVKDLNGKSADELLSALQKKGFQILELHGKEITNAPGTINLFVENKWYALKIPAVLKDSANPKQGLDVYILDKYIFDEILDINDTRSSNKIRYANGEVSMETLLSPIQKGYYEAAFTLSPVTVEEIIKVSDFGETMPPKSTWIEPKLRSGLILHEFERN